MPRWVLLMTMLTLGAWAEDLGIVNREAPAWNVKLWHQLPKGKSKLDISDYKGKVVYLYAFQAWCPGCHSHGFPTLKKLTEEFRGRKDIVFVAIQTVFEGFSSNTFQRAKQMARKYQLKIPIGHSGNSHEHSGLMKAYHTGGTPWTIIIDREGVVRFNDFHVTVEQAREMIGQLLRVEAAASN